MAHSRYREKNIAIHCIKSIVRMNFQEAVIKRSEEIPVLVDFWAPWCGPCRILGPTIEQVAEEQEGKWELVKLNTEEQTDIAEQYQIRSIPNVKLFHKGAVIGEFTGALPKRALEDWLETYLPDPRKDTLDVLLEALNGPEPEAAVQQLSAFVEEHADFKVARVVLANQVIFTDPAKSTALIKDIKIGDKFHTAAEDLRTLADLMALELNGSAANKALKEAQMALAGADYEMAIQQIIEATTLDKNYANELPRRSGVALFRMWGNKHDLSKKYRWKFDMVLY